MRASFLAIQLVLLLTGSAQSQDCFRELFDSDVLERLLAEGEVSHTFRGSEPIQLFPLIDIRGSIEAELADIDITLGVEYLVIDDLDTYLEEEQALRIYNTLRGISTLKGIEYYSASRERMRVFFHDIYVIDDPDRRERIADPIVDEIPEESNIFALIRDSSLGNYVAEVTYIHRQDYFGMGISNWGVLRRYLIPMVRPGKLKSLILIMPCGQRVIFYGISYALTYALFRGVAREESFYNRLLALLNWFKQRYAALE